MTTKSWNRILVIVLIAETVLFIGVKSLRFTHRPTLRDYEATNPIAMALDYESPLWKFEKIVKGNPRWVDFRQRNQFSKAEVDEVMPVLAGCAILDYTNHVRILLENGADAEESICWLKKNGSNEAAALISAIRCGVISPARDPMQKPHVPTDKE